jgi:predicted type IV restriction endonuclease
MTGRSAIIKQRDVERILKGAAAAGTKLGIVVTNGEVRFLPVDDILPAEPGDELEQYRNKRDERRARRRAQGRVSQA